MSYARPVVDIRREEITRLAEPSLPNHRVSRYRGEEQVVELVALAESDRTLVGSLYGTLQELAALVAQEPLDAEALRAFAAREDVQGLVHQLGRLGRDVDDDVLAAAIHDIRGGALTALFVQLARVRRAVPHADLARSLSIMARDHMKMMRSVVKDLDPALRVRDLARRTHSLTELGQALQEFTGEVAGARVAIELTCDALADITESCVECAAVDRAAYNLLNNAVRHTDLPTIGVWLLTLGTDVRIAFANHVSAETRDRLAPVLADDPAALFGSFSTTGSGYGLRIVGDLVGRAYGVPSVGALTSGGYVGVKLEGEHVISWFHWPVAGA